MSTTFDASRYATDKPRSLPKEVRESLIKAGIAYFVSLGLDVIFRNNSLIKTGGTVSIDGLVPQWYTLCYYLVPALIVLGSCMAAGKWTRTKNLRQVGPGVLTLIVGSAFLAFGPNMLTPRVSRLQIISGTATDPQKAYYLFVREVGSSECWLQNPAPLRRGPDARWRASAHFGGARGKRFEILAIAQSTPLHIDKPGARSCMEIPPGGDLAMRLAVID